jgi:uncharacterized membrane protein (UPF0127 family)
VARLLNADTGEVVLRKLEIADTFWKRFLGLQFRQPLAADCGMLITPCSSLHTCFMRFPIDIILLDETNVVVGVKKHIRPWRAAICSRSTKRVIEVHHGVLDIAIGSRLEWGDEK